MVSETACTPTEIQHLNMQQDLNERLGQPTSLQWRKKGLKGENKMRNCRWTQCNVVTVQTQEVEAECVIENTKHEHGGVTNQKPKRHCDVTAFHSPNYKIKNVFQYYPQTIFDIWTVCWLDLLCITAISPTALTAVWRTGSVHHKRHVTEEQLMTWQHFQNTECVKEITYNQPLNTGTLC